MDRTEGTAMSLFKRPRGNGPEARTLRADEPECQGAGLAPAPPADVIMPREGEERAFAPHCDQRILHAPGECWACDLYPDWQALRVKWGIAFTGHQPEVVRLGVDQQEIPVAVRRELPCPADYNRPPESPSDHRQWGPNLAQGGRRG
jgi:hypothetical protein